MGYQALLFCPDEKLAGVVCQVFSEVDFTVETVLEPFGAVKKLMKQHYDALVVNSDNEQNASLLFKSARNSSFNQSSLAIALVEGQAGVAKAYRIGANLVLTKPINVEQAKGTLRVARGLLRKNADAASAGASTAANPSVPVKPAPSSAASSFPADRRLDSRVVPTMAAPSSHPGSAAEVLEDAPEFAGAPQAMIAESGLGETAPGQLRIHETTPGESTLDQTMTDEPVADIAHTAAPVKIENKPAMIPAAAARAEIRGVGASPIETRQPARQPAPIVFQDAPEKDSGKKNAVSSAAPPAAEATKPAQNTNSSNVGSAAAAAPAKNKAMESRPGAAVYQQATPATSTPTFGSLGASDAPSFAALGEENSGGSAGAKKGLIAAGIILGLAALSYIGYGMLGNSSRTAPVRAPVSAPQNSDNPPATVRPMSAPITEPAQTTLDRASVESPASASKTPVQKTKAAAISVNAPLGNSASGTSTTQVIRIGGNSTPVIQKAEAAPLLVKSNPAPSKTPVRADDSSTPPSPPVVASADESAVSGLVSSAATNIPKPALATLKVSQGVTQGLLIKRVTPQYPSSALAVHAQGAVQIEAIISKDGNVINPKVLSGNPLLAQAALEAVRQWRYKPYTLDGVPVEIQTQITVNFKTN
jgi:TonB family protein